MRPLGIPTVLDRLIQQALHQVLNPLFDPGFSEHSYGFRPGRNAHQAVLKARDYQREGMRWVVDMASGAVFRRSQPRHAVGAYRSQGERSAGKDVDPSVLAIGDSRKNWISGCIGDCGVFSGGSGNDPGSDFRC